MRPDLSQSALQVHDGQEEIRGQTEARMMGHFVASSANKDGCVATAQVDYL